MKEGSNNLKKDIGLFTAMALVVGTVIGSGIFFKPQAVYSATGTAGLGLLAWLLGGLLTICAGLTVAELSASMRETGGMVVYIKKAYGNVASFLAGWVQIIVFFPATIAALSIIFATQVVNLYGIESYAKHIIIAILAASFVMSMNFISAKVGGRIQAVATIFKLIPLALITIVGLNQQSSVTFSLFPVVSGNHQFLTSLGAGLIATLFAYDGWIQVGTIAGEMKNPSRDLPKAITLGLAFVMVVYLIINIAYLSVLPAAALGSSATPATDVATILFGQQGGRIITVGILISVFGALNGYTMASIRVPYAMALENKLPFSHWLSQVGSNSGVPYNAGILILLLTIVMIFSGQFNQLTDMSVFSIWIFYILTFLAVIKLRKTAPNMERPYRVPFYPVIPIIAIIGGSYVIINTLFVETLNAMTGIFLTLIGLPIYYLHQKRQKRG